MEDTQMDANREEDAKIDEVGRFMCNENCDEANCQKHERLVRFRRRNGGSYFYLNEDGLQVRKQGLIHRGDPYEETDEALRQLRS